MNFVVDVCGNLVKETRRERLLGLVVNSHLTWSDYLNGENWRQNDNFVGLIPQLNQRVGLLSNIAHLMPRSKFNLLCNGIFYSKLLYCLQVFSNVWTNHDLDEDTRRYTACTKSDMNKLQTLQNKIMRLKTGLGYDCSTKELTEKTGDLSVHQLSAYATLTSAHKIIITKQPEYLSSKLKLRTKDELPSLPERHENSLFIRANLTLVRSGFFYRSAALFNQLPLPLRSCNDVNVFKSSVKKWVKLNVPVKPS